MDRTISRNEMFENAPIPRAVATQAIPTMVTTLIMLVYNLADTFFIGQTGDAVQVAAVSIAMPVFTVLMSVGSLFGMGGNSNISRALGAGKKDRVKHISAFCFWGCIIVGVIMAIIILIFLNPILHLVGASKDNIGYAGAYLRNIAMGAPLIILAGNCANMMRGEGAATFSMVGNMIGTITNIILDPIFILVLGMGVSGAAIATVLGNALAVIYYLFYFWRSKTVLSINPRNFRLGDKIATGVLAIGIPSALNQLLMSVAQIVMNTTIGKYGDTPLAAMNIAFRCNMIVVFVQMGLCMGIMPLIGFNYGSGNKKRLIGIYRFTAITTVILGTILTIIMVVIRRSLVTAFINDQEVVSYGMHFLVILQMSGPVVGLSFINTSSLQGMGKALWSMILSLCRQVLVYIPAVIILDRTLGLGGLIWAQPISDYVSIVLGLIITLNTIRRMKPAEKYLTEKEKQKLQQKQQKQIE